MSRVLRNAEGVPLDVRAVVFDVGETLVDESRAWADQARRAGITPFLLMASIGALIAAGRDHRDVWDVLITGELGTRVEVGGELVAALVVGVVLAVGGVGVATGLVRAQLRRIQR